MKGPFWVTLDPFRSCEPAGDGPRAGSDLRFAPGAPGTSIERVRASETMCQPALPRDADRSSRDIYAFYDSKVLPAYDGGVKAVRPPSIRQGRGGGGGARTLTVGVLSALPLPIGLRPQRAHCRPSRLGPTPRRQIDERLPVIVSQWKGHAGLLPRHALGSAGIIL